ncbi:MAG: hypothetical protein K1Y02_09665 [Candidatus Hydrogenedentes bacterium]|nr:hypothetical protein [Candidatus Hydrogenedentota bacterium]
MMSRLLAIAILITPYFAAHADLEMRAQKETVGVSVSVYDGEQTVFTPFDSGLRVAQPTGTTDVLFRDFTEENGTLTSSEGTANGLTLTQTFRVLSPVLIERTVTVTTTADERYYLDLGWKCAVDGGFFSFMGPETKTATYTPSCAGSEFGVDAKQTFPFMGVLAGDRLYGIIGETAGMWENRQFMTFDVDNRSLSFCNGDGSAKRTIMIPRNIDATSVYRAVFDGWQHIEIGETQSYKTWLFTSPAKSLYDVQLAAHLALANAKGFNHSSLEAILRNTSYMLLRRNLLRPESDYIFISGTGYGWKQWVSDGFWMSRGLDDPKYDAEAQAAVFFERINYEDNAQYYLIWAALVKRTGANPDERTVGRAYRFIREHEKDGLYIPPRLHADKLCYKTYHDQLPYEDGDAPSSNQGFHCGALMAAKELGFDVTDAEIDKAIEGYKRMFNAQGGYMATSLMQQDHVGQDALYGEVLTYCVFGRKLLPDDMVRTHLETSVRIQSPYGMRVISNADGSLLEGHEGVYTNGGSWFLNDGANYLDGLIHGMDPAWIDDKIMWRLEKELAFMPAFHESISTVHGKPHGHHLYSWNSGFWWLRKNVRERLGMSGPDPLDARLDAALGVKIVDGMLVLDPDSATLRPAP